MSSSEDRAAKRFAVDALGEHFSEFQPHKKRYKKGETKKSLIDLISSFFENFDVESVPKTLHTPVAGSDVAKAMQKLHDATVLSSWLSNTLHLPTDDAIFDSRSSLMKIVADALFKDFVNVYVHFFLSFFREKVFSNHANVNFHPNIHLSFTPQTDSSTVCPRR